VSVHAISGIRPVTPGASVDASLPPELLPLLEFPLLELEQAAIPPAAPLAARATRHKAKVVVLVTLNSSWAPSQV
jgi:hypothetical protein